MVIQTYNIELLMSNEDKQHWFNQLLNAKKAFNDCSSYIIQNDVPLNLRNVHESVYAWMRQDYPMLHSQAVIKIYKESLSALRSIKSNKHQNAQIPERKSLSMHLDKRLYGKLTKDGISISGQQPHHRTFIPFKLYDKVDHMFRTSMPKDPLIFCRKGRFFLSVPFEVQEKPLMNDNCIGVDLGVRQMFVTSEGKSYRNVDYLTKRRKLRYLKSKLQAKGTKSAKRHLKKLRNKERNISRNMCHNAANILIGCTNASIIVLEDLTKIKQNTSKTNEGYKRTRHNNLMSQVPFYTFRLIVEHKAQLAGKRVETVSPTYTSQMDYRTNKRDGERRGRRYYCTDGIVFDSDWNAAINIGQRSKHPVSRNAPIDGALTPLTGRYQSVCQSCDSR